MTYLHSHYPALAYNTRPSRRRTTSETVREMPDELEQRGQERDIDHRADAENRDMADEKATNPTSATSL
jgi:hypothetical protein